MRGEETAAGTSGTGESGASSPPDRTTDGDLERLQAVIERAADGDLTVRAGEEFEDEGVAAVAGALDDLLGRFERTVTDVDEFGDQVAGATGHVDGLVDDVKESSNEVSESVARISEGASEQAERIDTTVEELQALSASTEEVASSAEEVATTAESISERSQEGQAAANRAIDELGVIDERTDEALDRVGALNDRVQEIEDVVEFIGDVAERTNILALNASIEAARAGEEGSGFAVVAEEVKSLAEEAGDATDEIDASIEEVRSEATETYEEIEAMRERVDRGVETAEDALAVFAELADDIEETSEGVREISAATDDQAASVEEAVAMVEGIGDISDDTAERAARVADAADEQTTALTEVAASVSALGDRSEELRSVLEGYEAGRTAAAAAGDVTTVQFWHAMGGEKGLFLEQLVEEFEAEAGDVHVETASKGSYRGVFDATLSAAEEGSPPTVAQLYEIGTKRAMDSGAFAPVEPLLPDDELAVDALLDPVADYYSTDGTLWSMPFNSSTPVLYYDRSAFEAAGLDPDSPPATFAEVRAVAEALVDAGVVDVGITFANYCWFVEQWFAEANQPLVDRANGRAGTPTEAYLDGDVARAVFEWIHGMEADGLYHNPGIEARGEARSLFHDGGAAMLVDSTSSLTGVRDGADFPVGVGYFPVPDERHGVVVGGASLWVTDDATPAEQEAAARFLAWLAQPEQQARWHQESGYFPIHQGAVERLESSGWFDENPGYRTAVEQLLASESTPATNGARIGPFNTVRTLVSEAYEDVARGADLDDVLSGLDHQVEVRLERYREELAE